MKQSNSNKLIIGLTGNIGCGKSSISNVLQNLGYEIIDADKISREIFEMKSVVDEIRDYFPTVVDGDIIDRKKLGDIVFSNKEKLDILNKITHKVIHDIIIERVYNSENERVVIDAALLIEAGFENLIDTLVVVYCDEDIQIKRVMSRDNINYEDAKKRIDNQMSQFDKISKANYVIDNSNSWEETEKQINELISKLN